MSRFIDLSAPTAASPAELPEPLRTAITVHDRAVGAAPLRALTGGVVPPFTREADGVAIVGS